MGAQDQLVGEVCAVGASRKRGQRGQRCGGQRCNGWRSQRKAATATPIASGVPTAPAVLGLPAAALPVTFAAATTALAALPHAAATAGAFAPAALTVEAELTAAVTHTGGRLQISAAHEGVTSPSSEAGCLVTLPADVGIEADSEAGADPAPCRRVRFDLEAETSHEITPYAEIYGMHPRLFDFDRRFWMVPARGLPDRSTLEYLATRGLLDDDDDDGGSSDESDEEERQ